MLLEHGRFTLWGSVGSGTSAASCLSAVAGGWERAARNCCLRGAAGPAPGVPGTDKVRKVVGVRAVSSDIVDVNRSRNVVSLQRQKASASPQVHIVSRRTGNAVLQS